MAQQGGVELRGVVEEDEEEAQVEEQEEQEGGDDEEESQPVDWDRTCAYKTLKIVRVRDRYLGILYWSIVVAVILYIVIVAVALDGKHQRQEPGLGSTIVKFQGKAFNAKNEPFDEADLRHPEVEPSGAFIMTRSVTIKGQAAGACVDYDKPCRNVTAAEPKECNCDKASNHCKLPVAWCPSIGEGNIDTLKDDGATTIVNEMTKGMEAATLEFFAGISFPGMSKNFFVAGQTEEEPIGTHILQSISVGDLLTKAGVESYSEIMKTGAILSVAFYWNCDVESPACHADITVQRVDKGAGYFQKKSHYYKKAGKGARDATYMNGIKILVESSGIGKKTTLVLLLVQLGSCLALLRVASMVADFLMLNCYSDQKVKMYYKCKVIETQDYSDLQDRINIIQESEKETALLLRKTKNLGMGGGGRGGLAASILR
ncbi:unnamed protein product [Amoebophrya sp. A25]|nr:unnamed protein product [Amoebophrya sp. A25]|eukprot:GSA25T00012493001.1